MSAGGAGAAVNRNDPCPCGSGRKYKNCCLRQNAPRAAARPAPAVRGAGTSSTLRQAQTLHQTHRLDAAAELYREVLERKPREKAALLGLGQIMEERGDLEAAARLLQRAVEAGCRTPAHHVQLGVLLAQLGRPEESLRQARRALAIDVHHVGALALVALDHERMNRLDEALEAVGRACAVDPDDHNVALAQARLLRRKGALPEARAKLEWLLERPSAAASRAATYHELGTVLDALGEHDAAYAAFGRAGAEDGGTPAFRKLDRDLPARRVAAYRAGIGVELARRWSADDLDDGRPAPVFLVGFPRSGTTMTEQVLAAHPDIVTTDERPLLVAVTDELTRALGGDDFGARLSELDRDRLLELRELYWSRVESVLDTPLGDRVLVDKHPLNLIDLGLIDVLLPDAKVMVALRDPRDACLSCFMQHFRPNPAMINFLTLERTTEFYADVMGFWLHVRDLLSVPWIEVRYEDTVRDLAAEARRVLGFLGVPWHDDVLRFHERSRDRLISTPSYTAVTEPVHTRAIGRWRNYRRQFAPLLPRLAPFVDVFGYEADDGAEAVRPPRG